MALTEREQAILKTLELELSEDFTPEDFQTGFNEKFISLKMAPTDPRVVGQFNGSLGTRFKKMLDPVVGGWEDGETNWGVPEKVVETAISKLQKQRENYENALAELKEANKTGTKKDQSEALEKLQQYEKELADVKKMKDTIAAEYDNYKNEVIQEKRNGKIQSIYKKPFDDLAGEVSEDFLKNEVIKAGTHTILNKKYKLDLDEDGETEAVIDAATGERLKTPNGTSYERWGNVVKRELDTLGYLKKNTGKSDFGNPNPTPQPNPVQPTGNIRRMAPEVKTGVASA